MTLPAEEFIRRFLIHVLPDGFHRIRYFGFLGNCHRARKLALCRELLGMAPAEPSATGYSGLGCSSPAAALTPRIWAMAKVRSGRLSV